MSLYHIIFYLSVLPEQLNSFFCTSATLSPRSSGGLVHWVKRPSVGLCLSHWANQAKWQSQFRLLEWSRLLKDNIFQHGYISKDPQHLHQSLDGTHHILSLWGTLIGTLHEWIVNGTFKKRRNAEEDFSKPAIPNTAFLECSISPE